MILDNQGKLYPRIGRAKIGRIVNVHGDNKKDEETARQFDMQIGRAHV